MLNDIMLVTVPVLWILIVSNSIIPPPAVSYYCILYGALIVEPAEELRGLPVVHRVMSARSITITVGPNHLRLHKITLLELVKLTVRPSIVHNIIRKFFYFRSSLTLPKVVWGTSPFLSLLKGLVPSLETHLILIDYLHQRRQKHFIWKLRIRAVVGIVLQVERVEPLPEAVV